MNRTDQSAMVFGAGVQCGFTFDEAYNFELRANNRTAVENRQVSIGTLIMRIRGSAGNYNVGIKRTNAVELLDVNGNIRYNGTTYNASDKRLKKDINKFSFRLRSNSFFGSSYIHVQWQRRN